MQVVKKMYELHKLIGRLQERKEKFELEYNEEEDLIKVRNTLNQRVSVLQKKFVENPENQSVLLEYGFLQDEINRINKKLAKLEEKYSTQEAKIEKYEKLVNFDVQELFSYVEFMKKFNMDEKLCDALQDSLISLNKNIEELNKLYKKE